MIVKEKSKAYSSKRTMIHGQGFVDTLKGVGSYISQNKDLITKPMLGAVGEIGALAMVEGSKALMRKMTKEKNKSQLDAESQQIIESLKFGSGIKKF